MARLPASASSSSGPPKRRGSYNCGRCGLPKKGHVCSASASEAPAAPPRSDPRLRRALSFEEEDEEAAEMAAAIPTVEPEEGEELGGGLPAGCLAEVLRRLPPRELVRAAVVCRGWREGVRRVLRTAEELRLRVGPRSPLGFVGSLLHKCSALVRLTLRIERFPYIPLFGVDEVPLPNFSFCVSLFLRECDIDAMVLACVAFSCPNLEAFEINVADRAINRMTGDELGRFVAEKRCLSSLKLEGCSNLGILNIFSSSLSVLWLSDLYCISKMAINCPNLKELSLDFSRQENDSTDLVSMMECLGRNCPRLKKLHISSTRLSNEAVLALVGANLRGLCILSLVLGSKITDASVAAIVSCSMKLELLDLSGSSITDNGIGMICNAFPESLSRLLLALCPNITSSGIQFATAQLPLLQLIDCGMSICDLSSRNENLEENMMQNNNGTGELQWCQNHSGRKPHAVYQKLIIKHDRLKKISLWGCSGLDALYLNCPELNDLNLNLCTNLHPDRLLLQCPHLANVHLSGCQNMLIGAIRNQMFNEFAALENQFLLKRLADGSKRVQAPQFIIPQRSPNDHRVKRARQTQCTVHL